MVQVCKYSTMGQYQCLDSNCNLYHPVAKKKQCACNKHIEHFNNQILQYPSNTVSFYAPINNPSTVLPRNNIVLYDQTFSSK
jgi:hypothetical protein